MVLRIDTTGFSFGIRDVIEARSIPRGAASSSLNWLTRGDHIEIRPGQAYLGDSSVNTGNGHATGLKKATRSNGVEILFGTYGKKLKYYDVATMEWIENGSDLLGTAVVDSNGFGLEDIFMSEYTSPAGNQLFLNSPNCAGYFKIMVANPGSALNVYSSGKNFKGLIKIDTNRTLLWDRTADASGLYGSYIDVQTYTAVTNEVLGTGDGATKQFTDTAAAISGTHTIFGATATDGTETFTDDYNGTMVGSLGGTGTINYITGVIIVNFATAPVNSAPLTWSYQWEDSNANGISDFTKSGTRTAGQGFIFRQDEGGGGLQAVATYSSIYYCFHLKKTWALTIGSDDTTATNLPYRELVGIPNHRAVVETGDGIYYIDDTNKEDVRCRLLTYQTGGSGQIIPVAVSNNINLNNYNFDAAAGALFGDIVCFACATSDSTQTINGLTVPLNNRMLVHNKLWGSWDVLDYSVTCLERYSGTLVGGDSLSNNFITLFSGLDDFGAESIPNYWIGALDNLALGGKSFRLLRIGQSLKKVKKLYLQGLIGIDQKLKVSVSLDDGDFVEIGGVDNADGSHTYCIEGGGSYVGTGNPVDIGSVVIGKGTIGGQSDGVSAYNYERLVDLRLDKFERIMIKFEAIATGYVSVSTQSWWDVRTKGIRIPEKYRESNTQ